MAHAASEIASSQDKQANGTRLWSVQAHWRWGPLRVDRPARYRVPLCEARARHCPLPRELALANANFERIDFAIFGEPRSRAI